MLKEPTAQQHELEMVCLESLVPDNHLLRKIDQYIDFEFIRARVRHLYCSNNGRPALGSTLSGKVVTETIVGVGVPSHPENLVWTTFSQALSATL